MKTEGFIDGLKRLLYADTKPHSTRHMKPVEEVGGRPVNVDTKKQVTKKERKAKRRRSNNSRKNNRP